MKVEREAEPQPAGAPAHCGAERERPTLGLSPVGALTPAAVLRMQRAAGNRAVGRLVTARAQGAPTAGVRGGLDPWAPPPGEVDELDEPIGGVMEFLSDLRHGFRQRRRPPAPVTTGPGGPPPPGPPHARQHVPPNKPLPAPPVPPRPRHVPPNKPLPPVPPRRPPVAKPLPPVPPPITISTTAHTGPTWKAYGGFDWRVGFTTTGRSGWIVQEIVNTMNVFQADGSRVNTSSVLPRYWEAWAVDAVGAVTPAIGADNDYWIRPARGAGTRGDWTMTGNCYFTTTDPATQGFRANSVSNAGILLATTTAPTGLGPVRLRRHAGGNWDDTVAPAVAHTGAAGP